MGTNYYLHTNVCENCRRGESVIHIGKSSGGWCFSLHVYPDGIGEHRKVINTLEDWKALWAIPFSVIRNEYGEDLSPEKMETCITNRQWSERPDVYAMIQNNAESGPNNLWRHKVGGHVIAHGPGTYDLCVGEFF